MSKEEINCIKCKKFLTIGICNYSDICEDFDLFEPKQKENKGLFEEMDDIPYDDEPLSKKELKLIKKAIKQCKKGKTVRMKSLVIDKTIEGYEKNE